jgi:transketolase
MEIQVKTMRDTLIEKICKRMQKRMDIFFLSDDMGAPALDKLRGIFKDRFINVGIAEQNLMNISAGLALEGFVVYSYGIAAFLTTRAFEQAKNNISLMSQIKANLNINLIGVGAGLSYDMSGPSHHSFEDISIMMMLPHFIIFSPSDWVLAEKFVDFSIALAKPKYARLDGKPLPKIYDVNQKIAFDAGFSELAVGEKVCLVATGYMTHRALEVARECLKNGMKIGVLDVFLLKPLNDDLLCNVLKRYDSIITLEEGFINKCGLDTVVSNMLNVKELDVKLIKFGFKDKFILETGGRDYLHRLNHLNKESIIEVVKEVWTR